MDESQLAELIGSPRNGIFAAYDVIKLRYWCDKATTAEKFNEWQLARPKLKFPKYKFKTVYAHVVSFAQIIDWLGRIPQPTLEQLAGVHFAGKTETFAQPMPLNFTPEDLAAVCRNFDGNFSIYDALSWRDNKAVSGSSTWNRWKKRPQDVPRHRFDYDPQLTWVGTFQDIVRFMATVPGSGQAKYAEHAQMQADSPREEEAKQTEEATQEQMDRAVQDLAEEAHIVKQTAAVRLMTITEEDLLNSKCRVTPDGRFSIFDAIARRDGTSTHAAKDRYGRWNKDLGLVSNPNPETACAEVTKYVFPSEPKETPVAPFYVIIRLLAVIPGPGVASVRAQQAELTTRAMAGDIDLENAINERRSALPAAAQEVMMNGLESSNNAKRMREEQADLERPDSKRQRLNFNSEQLVALAKGAYPSVTPEPIMLEMLWDSVDGQLKEFIKLYVDFCKEIANERRLDLQTEAEIKIKEEERKNKEDERKMMAFRVKEELKMQKHRVDETLNLERAKCTEELKLQEKHSNDDIQVKMRQADQVVALKEKQVNEEIKLLAQKTKKELAETTKAEKELKALELKVDRLANRDDRQLAYSDKIRVLKRTFPENMSAKCDVKGCHKFVCLLKCRILELEHYAVGDIDKLRVVCGSHAKEQPHKIYVFEMKDIIKCKVWLHTVGSASHTKCALCGQCCLALWDNEAERCHVRAVAQGGSEELDNSVIGRRGCNLQQGVSHLGDYRRIIRSKVPARQTFVPEDKLDAVMKELKSWAKDKCEKCPLMRMQSILKPKYRQPKLD